MEKANRGFTAIMGCAKHTPRSFLRQLCNYASVISPVAFDSCSQYILITNE